MLKYHCGAHNLSGTIISADFFFSGSHRLIERAKKDKLCSGRNDFSLQKYSDKLTTWGAGAHPRRCRMENMLQQCTTKVGVQDMFSALRDHKTRGKAAPIDGYMGADLCTHFGPTVPKIVHTGAFRPSQCCGSLVAHWKHGQLTLWFTSTSTPCLSIFKPCWLKGDVPPHFTEGNNDDTALGLEGVLCPKHKQVDGSLWWQHEVLSRNVTLDYAKRSPIVIEKCRKVEAELLRSADGHATGNFEQRKKWLDEVIMLHHDLVQALIPQVQNVKLSRTSCGVLHEHCVARTSARVQYMAREITGYRLYKCTWQDLLCVVLGRRNDVRNNVRTQLCASTRHQG
eukprot:TRINITY_DN68120_c1_g4_i5.p1 TRINITY_DN68120_c1_g4~~TRINITY_DN68120_c1_g4_i5.p1  ORF type:complete len:340 (-),score=30.38 TRINITY_DN68120_c1_g4_i5:878-1897(-)